MMYYKQMMKVQKLKENQKEFKDLPSFPIMGSQYAQSVTEYDSRSQTHSLISESAENTMNKNSNYFNDQDKLLA